MRFVHLPHAAIRLDRFGRYEKYHRVRLLNQTAEARFPFLTGRNVVAVEEWREATIFETRHQFVGERGRILPRIGNENLKLLSCASLAHTATRRDLTNVAALR